MCLVGFFSGWLSDMLGRLNTLRAVLAISMVTMPALYRVGAHVAALYLGVFVVYFCYGTQASVNPATVSDFWGTRHAGANYGLAVQRLGIAGIIGPTIGGVLFDRVSQLRSRILCRGTPGRHCIVVRDCGKASIAVLSTA